METKKKLVIGILAHVDAGKTTLSESILYLTGSIRKLGRVDHRDAFLDTYEMERERGITIFSKQAEFRIGDTEITLLDTPGHVDFSAEMERTLQVLDYAILVISGSDGIQGHVQTLWKLLKRYEVPVFLFINKMDQPDTDRNQLIGELQRQLDEHCVIFDCEQNADTFQENLAVCDESVLEEYLEKGSIGQERIRQMIAQRKVFPCYFGSALKVQGIEEFLDGIETYTCQKVYPDVFAARVYKIGRDEKGTRLTYMKVTGGSLKVRTVISNRKEGTPEEEVWEEKADQIRIYSGAQYQSVQEVFPGTICAVTGLTRTRSGQGLGAESESEMPILEPVLTYQIQLPPECDVYGMFLKLRQLEEEEPQLHITWKESLNEIHAQVMGEVQIDILKNMIRERFGVLVEFGEGSIVYKETIAAPVEGVGHYEPLRHYAEVHLLLEPGEPGSGLQFGTVCSEDVLGRNWQRLILTHLEEKKHLGVLTGSEITDMKITLTAGRAHLKHTEGGDFRQATYRAVRQGLRQAESILLEPVYEYRLEVPTEHVGRALSDIQKMKGNFEGPHTQGDYSVLTGTAPVVRMRGYQTEVIAYTKGRGRLSCILKGYEPCKEADHVIEKVGYDPDSDLENPTGSVFCAHGAGFVVPWYQVPDYMHLESTVDFGTGQEIEEENQIRRPSFCQQRERMPEVYDEEELKEIFRRTYGSTKREKYGYQKKVRVTGRTTSSYSSYPAKKKKKKEYLLVDGYNIIFAWKDLKELAEVNLEAARNRLADLLCDYQGYKRCTLILVFDAYKVERGVGEVQKYHNIYIVYTKEAETADQYIEKTVHEIGKQYDVTVATSDATEQVIILGQGAGRLSAAGLLEEMEEARNRMREEYLELHKKSGSTLFEHLSQEAAEEMEKVRLGVKTFNQISGKE